MDCHKEPRPSRSRSPQSSPAAGDPAALPAAAIREVRAADPNAVMEDVRTMEDRLRDSLAARRFSASVLGAFALFAVLPAMGVYGVIS